MEHKPQDFRVGGKEKRGRKAEQSVKARMDVDADGGIHITDLFLRYLGAIVLAIVFAVLAVLSGDDELRTAFVGFIGLCVGFIVGTASAPEKKTEDTAKKK